MRKILIIQVGKVEEYQQMAIDNDISEIVEGIPKSLSNLYSDDILPIIHIEDDPIPTPNENEILNEKIISLQKQLESAQDAIDFLLMNGGI